MSHSTVQVLSIPAPAVPRGAILVDLIFSALRLLFSRTAARKLTRTEEAAQVREMAHRLQNTDPSFAADLMAAASRHESLDDDLLTARR